MKKIKNPIFLVFGFFITILAIKLIFVFLPLIIIFGAFSLIKGSGTVKKIIAEIKKLFFAKKTYEPQFGTVYKQCPCCGAKTEREAVKCDKCGAAT